MKTLFILILFVVMLMIIISKDTKRLVWLMAGIFFLNDTISIQPFSSYTLILTAFFMSLVLHKEAKAAWKSFPFKALTIVVLIIHVLVVQFDKRSFNGLAYISRVFNNFVPRFFALFVGYAAITSTQVWKRVSKPLYTIFLIMCIYGFMTFFFQSNPYYDMLCMSFNSELGIWSGVQDRGYRVFSTLNNPIVYSYVMFLATTYLYLQRRSFGKLEYALLTLLTVLNAFLANSRTGLVAGVLLLALYALVEYRFSYRVVVFLASGLIIFALLYQNLGFVKDSADSVFDIIKTGGQNTNGSTTDLKQDQLETSLFFFSLHPFFGNGFNYYQEVIGVRYDTGKIGLAGLEGYGYKLLVEEGIFMIIAVVLLFFQMLLFFFKRLSIKQYSSMGIAWVISFLFYMLTAGSYGGIFTIGMIFIGMLVKYVQIQCFESKEPNRSNGR